MSSVKLVQIPVFWKLTMWNVANPYQLSEETAAFLCKFTLKMEATGYSETLVPSSKVHGIILHKNLKNLNCYRIKKTAIITIVIMAVCILQQYKFIDKPHRMHKNTLI